MNVLVAGATGKTGQRVVRELLSRGHQPVALVRESSDTSNLPNEVVLREGDLTNLQDDICADCESVVFAAGSGGDTSKEMTDKVDRDGAMRLTDIAVNSDTKRFIMLSSVGADDPPAEGDMAHYLQAKHDADEHLKASGLNYSILRPVSLTDEEGMREIIIGDEVNKKATAARGDVAAVLAQALDNDQWLGQTVTMQSR
ncbi:SDR family oxidoreductase [Hirschia baltica]|uniref:NAD-dependent epimerase/dehydratase n=1 Tax=Hirschia baltica (strain ATCC 49814 / DSM 5838 / IFAM 1418) TaxID=582402 RepID=C6XL50_HIRBI|nr:SDR family oxidoreductase [Hirschia baltica]ACT57879.1 NAD-dependent epimerase/dehydratase [Hirschia baltica ATCC 49814]